VAGSGWCAGSGLVSWWAGGQWSSGAAALQPVCRWADSAGCMGVIAPLFFQCIVTWRSLSLARVNGANVPSFPGALPQPGVSPGSHKVPDSQSSLSLCMCPTHHFGP
jgi:hypothetical protein